MIAIKYTTTSPTPRQRVHCSPLAAAKQTPGVEVRPLPMTHPQQETAQSISTNRAFNDKPHRQGLAPPSVNVRRLYPTARRNQVVHKDLFVTTKSLLSTALSSEAVEGSSVHSDVAFISPSSTLPNHNVTIRYPSAVSPTSARVTDRGAVCSAPQPLGATASVNTANPPNPSAGSTDLSPVPLSRQKTSDSETSPQGNGHQRKLNQSIPGPPISSAQCKKDCGINESGQSNPDASETMPTIHTPKVPPRRSSSFPICDDTHAIPSSSLARTGLEYLVLEGRYVEHS